MNGKIEGIVQFSEWYGDRSGYVRRWKKRTGGRVVANLCGYGFEEVVMAAGALPISLLGAGHGCGGAEVELPGALCPFCSNDLRELSCVGLDYADGAVVAQKCLQQRRSYSFRKSQLPVGFVYRMSLPNAMHHPAAKPFMNSEAENFIKAIEAWTGSGIEYADLASAIETANENRRLLKKLYELRKGDAPPISGSDALTVVAACGFVDKTEANDALRSLLDELTPLTPVDEHPEPRLMIIGAESDPVNLAALIEAKAARVVVDDHCAGSRYFWNEVEITSDPVKAIADRYCLKPPCSTMDYTVRARLPHLDLLIRDWRVDGAIVTRRGECDPSDGQAGVLLSHLKRLGVPFVCIELGNKLLSTRLDSLIEEFISSMAMEEVS